MKTIEVVAAVIIYDKEILCMQRGENQHEYLSHKYEFPGGKVEPGESCVDALKRELKEEMDIEVNIEEKNFFLTVQHQYPDFGIIMHSYICNVNKKEFVRKEHADHVWLTKDKLLTLDWAAADIPIVKQIVNGEINNEY